jgi:hypothetical protein
MQKPHKMPKVNLETRKKYDSNKLLFRRQFILGPRFVDRFESWKRVKVRDTHCLTVHPDLPICNTEYGNKSLTLLGYILDPNNPEYLDLDILKRLLHQLCISDSLDDLFNYTAPFGGRWILIVDSGLQMSLFNDAAGYRQVFYATLPGCQDVWCASQPGILADILGLKPAKEAVEYLNLVKASGRKEYFFPGDSSLYKEIKHLLPNHYLDLMNGSSHRYWPNCDLAPLSLEECVERSSIILTGLMKSASNRFDLALSMTAGGDTRLVLAAAREIRDKVSCYTLVYWDLNEKSPDIAIPLKLLSRLGISHTIIKCPARMDDEFRKLYEKNVDGAHSVYGGIVQGLYNEYPVNKLFVKGTAIGVTKCLYHSRFGTFGRGRVTAKGLASLMNSEHSSFAVNNLETWLSDARKTYNINILHLYMWEIREGNWQAMTQLEWDLAQEVFVPFNCRSLLTVILSLDEKYRKPPEYIFRRALIAKLWPDLLIEPINPPFGIRSRTKELLVKTRLYPFVSPVYYFLKHGLFR